MKLGTKPLWKLKFVLNLPPPKHAARCFCHMFHTLSSHTNVQMHLAYGWNWALRIAIKLTIFLRRAYTTYRKCLFIHSFIHVSRISIFQAEKREWLLWNAFINYIHRTIKFICISILYVYVNTKCIYWIGLAIVCYCLKTLCTNYWNKTHCCGRQLLIKNILYWSPPPPQYWSEMKILAFKFIEWNKVIRYIGEGMDREGVGQGGENWIYLIIIMALWLIAIGYTPP